MTDTPTLLVDTVERLCEEMDPGAITMRRIAAEAGVSLGLAYHYFGSKEKLFGSVLDRIAADIATGVEPTHAPQEALDELWDRLQKRPAFVRLITSFILQRKDVSSIMSGHPMMANVAARAAETGHPDPPVAAATLAFLGLGGAFYAPPLNNAIGRSTEDPALFDAISRLLVN